jgi:protease-4
MLRVAAVTGLLAISVFVVLKSTSWLQMLLPSQPTVAFVPIYGSIEESGPASAKALVPVIRRACTDDSVEIVVLQINSPGGSASEAERINAAITQCKQQTGTHSKKVYAVLDGMAASAAYLIAMKADRIYAGKYTVVGSIGAIIRYTDISDLASRWGIHERNFKTSPLKGGTSMLSGSSPQADAANQALVDDLGQVFLKEVLNDRKGKLKIDIAQLYSGKVWTGEQALAFGLVDAIGTRESLEEMEFKTYSVREFVTGTEQNTPLHWRELIESALLKVAEPTIR